MPCCSNDVTSAPCLHAIVECNRYITFICRCISVRRAKRLDINTIKHRRTRWVHAVQPLAEAPRSRPAGAASACARRPPASLPWRLQWCSLPRYSPQATRAQLAGLLPPPVSDRFRSLSVRFRGNYMGWSTQLPCLKSCCGLKSGSP